MQAKVGRNDPCPCGSGRKFKQCCLNRAALPRQLIAPARATAPAQSSVQAPLQSPAQAQFERGLQLQARGQLEDAAASFRAVLGLVPAHVEAHVNLGNILMDLAQPAPALASYERALQLRPAMVELNLNIGLAQEALGRDDQAAATYAAALALAPGNAQMHNNLAMVLRKSGRLDEASASLRAALALAPRSAALHEGLAGVLTEQGRLQEALQCLRSALALEPGSAERHESLGLALAQAGDVDGAVQSLRRALQIDPQRHACHQALLLLLLYGDDQTPAAIAEEHRRYAARFADPLAPAQVRSAGAPDPERTLRIGYVSGDFRKHSVAFFIEPILQWHDRSRHVVYCYHTLPVEDEVTRRLRALSDRWCDCASLDDSALAERIRADGIDILVDLAGHTAGNRLLVFARRPAPVQLSWIGYPASTGLRQIDARLSDPVASPADLALPGAGAGGTAPRDRAVAGPGGAAADPLVRLPRIFSVYRPPAATPPPERLAPAEPARIELGSFNNLAKVSDTTVRIWSELLRRDPALRLTLKDKLLGQQAVREQLLARFAAHGIGAERLCLLGKLPSDREHLERYRAIDIALDTYPYGGVTTTCEALWMGVPVVSLAGPGFASRMGATLLHAIGRPGWVAADEEQYVRIVLALAADPQLRGALRAGLRSAMLASPLLDEAGVTRELEDAYRAVWAAWCATAPAAVLASP